MLLILCYSHSVISILLVFKILLFNFQYRPRPDICPKRTFCPTYIRRSRCWQNLVNEDHGQADADEESKQTGHVVLVHPEKVSLVQNLNLNITKSVRSENEKDNFQKSSFSKKKDPSEKFMAEDCVCTWQDQFKMK